MLGKQILLLFHMMPRPANPEFTTAANKALCQRHPYCALSGGRGILGFRAVRLAPINKLATEKVWGICTDTASTYKYEGQPPPPRNHIVVLGRHREHVYAPQLVCYSEVVVKYGSHKLSVMPADVCCGFNSPAIASSCRYFLHTGGLILEFYVGERK